MMLMTKRWRHIDFAAWLSTQIHTTILFIFLRKFDVQFCDTSRMTKSLTYTMLVYRIYLLVMFGNSK